MTKTTRNVFTNNPLSTDGCTDRPVVATIYRDRTHGWVVCFDPNPWKMPVGTPLPLPFGWRSPIADVETNLRSRFEGVTIKRG